MMLPHLSALVDDMIRFVARVLFLVVLGLAVAPTTAAQSGWLTKALREAGEAGGDAARRAGGQLDEAASALKKLSDEVSAGSVAASVSTEGHWTFINRAGQKFTAASPEEMGRLSSALFPDGTGPTGLTIYVTEPAIFAQRAALKALPSKARLRLVVGRKTYPLTFRDVRDGAGQTTRRLYVDVRRNVVVPVTEPKALEEAIWQLNRQLNRSEVRVLSLSRDGPAALPPVGSVDSATKRAVVDRIAANHLTNAIASLKGQTAVITGRIDGGKLIYRTARGFDDEIDLKAVRQAAVRSDVNLVILNSQAPRQPGSRNWLWQKVDVEGLSHALGSRDRADFLGSLAGAGGKVEVRIAAGDRDRVSLSIVTLRQGLTAPGAETITGWIAEVASEVAGSVVTKAVEMDVVSRRRQSDLDLRIVPGIPSDYQIGYLMLVVAGVFGWPYSHAWWRWLWPLEVRGEYGGWFGYQAARAARLVLFVLLFLPLAGVPAVICHLLHQLWFWMTLPWRMLRWLFGKRSAEEPA